MSTESLAGRRVLITGGSRGLGRAIATAIGHAGGEPILAARSADQLSIAVEQLRADGTSASSVVADLSDRRDIDALVSRVCRAGLHGVVHAAGIQHRAAASEFSDADFARVLGVNLIAPFTLARELVTADRHSTLTSQVFIGSLGSSIAIPRAVAYSAAKSGLLGLARTLATEWAPRGVRANVLSPGYFHTELTDDLLSDSEQRARITSRIPMGRLGRPDELGGPAVFLLCDASSYVTGQQLVVDGGWLGS